MKAILLRATRRTNALTTERVAILGAVAAVACGMLLPFSVSAQDPGLPDAPGKQVVVENCSACHDLALITSQHKSAEDWEATVNRMIANGVTLDESQYDQVVAYLAKNLPKDASSASTHAVPSVAHAPAVKQTPGH